MDNTPAQEMWAAIADKVRAESQTACKPMHVEDLGILFPDRAPEEIVNELAELVAAAEYPDIKVLTSAGGATYLYSDKVMPPEEASEKILADETCASIAETVRRATREEVRLTTPQALAELAPDLPAEKLAAYVGSLPENEAYRDIRQVVGPTGVTYLYSDTHMTGNYATLLARAEANDPFTTIAETVREESHLYPRPTKIALFYEPLFKIPEEQMSVIVESLLKRPEFSDIKKIEAPTGAIYLYSDKYMAAAAAERYVHWEEVERWTSM